MKTTIFIFIALLALQVFAPVTAQAQQRLAPQPAEVLRITVPVEIHNLNMTHEDYTRYVVVCGAFAQADPPAQPFHRNYFIGGNLHVDPDGTSHTPLLDALVEGFDNRYVGQARLGNDIVTSQDIAVDLRRLEVTARSWGCALYHAEENNSSVGNFAADEAMYAVRDAPLVAWVSGRLPAVAAQ